jgi:hypothetical protein
MEDLNAGDNLFSVVDRMHGPVLVTAVVIEYDKKMKMAYFSEDCGEVVIRDLMDGGRAKLKWFRSAHDAITEKTEQVDAKWRSELAKYENLRPIPTVAMTESTPA